jgi:hypothetical protein
MYGIRAKLRLGVMKHQSTPVGSVFRCGSPVLQSSDSPHSTYQQRLFERSFSIVLGVTRATANRRLVGASGDESVQYPLSTAPC